MNLAGLIIAATLTTQTPADLGREAPVAPQSKPASLRYPDEAPAAWRTLVDRCSKLSWSGTFKSTFRRDVPGANGGEKEDGSSTSKYQYHENGPEKRVVVQTGTDVSGKRFSADPGPGESTVEGTNPSYYFSLRRSNPNDPYTLKSRQMMPIDRPRLISNAQVKSVGMVCSGRLPRAMSLLEVHKDPSLKMKKVSDVRLDAKDFVRLDFEYTPWPDRPPFTDAWVILDPECHWAVVESGYASTSNGAEYRFHNQCEYDRAEGFPIVKRITRTTEVAAESAKSTDVFEFDKWEYAEPPDSVFHLPAYGLAE